MVVCGGPDGDRDDDVRRVSRVLRVGHGDGGAKVSPDCWNTLPVLLHIRIRGNVSRRLLPQQQLALTPGFDVLLFET